MLQSPQDGERLNLVSDPNSSHLPVNEPRLTESDSGKSTEKNYLGIRFQCCSVYARIYKNREGTAYTGHCPKCASPVRIKIGHGGTSSRFFTFGS